MPVLIVEPNTREAASLSECIKRHGLVPLMTDTMKSALSILGKEGLELVLMSLNGNKQRVVDFLQSSRLVEPVPPVIVLAEHASLEDATEMMRFGAFDFWVKPVQTERLAKTIGMITDRETAAPEIKDPDTRPIITQNPRMIQLKTLAQRIAGSNATVLVQGESGTGKELLARFIHRESDRRDKPFIALNCAALPEGLLESELFGHEKGAFTGAIKAKEGKFELANTGTLLLDEITEIPVHLQAKLLRVLQESEVDRIGGRYPVKVDVRVIATTNASIEKSVAEGLFRKDLYYRLNVIPLKIPPLRERRDDIALLARHFCEKYSTSHKRRLCDISPESMKRLQAHSWPGNVRELENVIQRGVLLNTGSELTPECLLFDGDEQTGAGEIELMSIGEMERILISKALGSVQGNRTKAAEILGISVRTLRNKLHEYKQCEEV
jgi:DNA-binding NtrC family response regulator